MESEGDGIGKNIMGFSRAVQAWLTTRRGRQFATVRLVPCSYPAKRHKLIIYATRTELLASKGGGIMRVERCELHNWQLGGVLLTVEDIKEKEEEGKGRRRREEGVCSSPNCTTST